MSEIVPYENPPAHTLTLFQQGDTPTEFWLWNIQYSPRWCNPAVIDYLHDALQIVEVVRRGIVLERLSPCK